MNLVKKILKKENAQAFPYPVSFYQDNLLITPEKDVWAYYFIPAMQIPLFHSEEAENQKTNIQLLFDELGKKYHSVHLFMCPYNMELSTKFKGLSEDYNTTNRKISTYYADRTVHMLKEMYGDISNYKYVLGVKIRHFNSVLSRIEAIKKGMQEVEKEIVKALGNVQADGKALLKQMQEIEEDLYQELAIVQAERPTTEEMAYIQRKSFLKTIEHSRLKEQREQSLEEITEAILRPNVKRGVLGIQTEYGTMYVSMLPISEFPDNLSNCGLFYIAQRFSATCEFHIKAEALSNKSLFFGTEAKVKGKEKELKSSIRDMERSGLTIGKKLRLAFAKNNSALQDIEGDVAFYQSLCAFVVYGRTPKECRSRARQIRQALRKFKIRCEMPLVDQERLFHSLLLGSAKSTMKHWTQYFTSHGIAQFLFGVSNELGNNIGWFLGVQTDGIRAILREKAVRCSKRIVLWNPLASNQNINGANASPHIDITGLTGNGKSFLLKVLFWILLLMNVKVLYFDPKNELEKMIVSFLSNGTFKKKYFPFYRLIKQINCVTLDARQKENHGVLDPIVFLPPIEAKKVAEDILNQIYDYKKDDKIRNRMMACLNRVIDDRKEGKPVGLRTWVEMLLCHKNPEIREVGEIFENEIEGSVLELIFSDGGNEGLSLEKASTILSVEGLTLPKPDQNPLEYTQNELNSIAVMCCIGEFIRLFGKQDITEYTYEIFDESWVLSTSAIGRRIINEIKKVGRAQCNACIFTSQSVRDTDSEEVKGQIGTTFAFDEPSEREAILKKLNMPITKENIELLKNLKQGQCLMQDSYGRVNKLSVHCLFEEWTIANKTVERTVSGDLEEKYA